MIVRALKLPLILAYILSGVLASFFSQQLALTQLASSFDLLSKLGIAFLLFLVGIELNIKELKEVGFASVTAGFGQVFFTSFLGFFLARFFRFDVVSSFYIAITLAFSSTIIIVKLLSEKGDLNSLYGRISVGLLLIQDLIAVVGLIFLASFRDSVVFPLYALIPLTLFKGLLLLILSFSLAKSLVPWVFQYLSKNSELLLIGAVGWALVLAMFSTWVGFSLEIGAFLAGLTLSASPFNLEIVAKIKPLRNFFIILFFITLGLSMQFSHFQVFLVPALFLSLFVLLGNPLILLTLMGFLGYKKRTSFLTGLTVAQISEFSLIIAAMGVSLGHLSEDVSSMVTVIAIVTITVSSYIIQEGSRIYKSLAPYLGIFERESFRQETSSQEAKGWKNHAILIGYHRIGSFFLEVFTKMRVKTLVLDFDPLVVRNLQKLCQGRQTDFCQAIHGDVTDTEILEEMMIERAKILVSTVPGLEENRLLLEESKRLNPTLPVIVTASQIPQALSLYEAGADYVILPQYLAGFAIAHVLEKHWEDLALFKKTRQEHIKKLAEMVD